MARRPDYEHDHEKWSVPGRHGYRLVLATWQKVVREPDDLLIELRTTITAGWGRHRAEMSG
jgi:hypothetical protein